MDRIAPRLSFFSAPLRERLPPCASAPLLQAGGEDELRPPAKTIFLHRPESHMTSRVPVAGQRGGRTFPRLALPKAQARGRRLARASRHSKPNVRKGKPPRYGSVPSHHSWSGNPRPVASNLDALPFLNFEYPSVVESGHKMRQPRAGHRSLCLTRQRKAGRGGGVCGGDCQ